MSEPVLHAHQLFRLQMREIYDMRVRTSGLLAVLVMFTGFAVDRRLIDVRVSHLQGTIDLQTKRAKERQQQGRESVRLYCTSTGIVQRGRRPRLRYRYRIYESGLSFRTPTVQ